MANPLAQFILLATLPKPSPKGSLHAFNLYPSCWNSLQFILSESFLNSFWNVLNRYELQTNKQKKNTINLVIYMIAVDLHQQVAVFIVFALLYFVLSSNKS